MGIHFQDVSYTYQVNTPFEGRALFDVDLTIEDGSYTAFVGYTGSGKSTLLQLMNGLLKPTSGTVVINDFIMTADSVDKDIKQVRKKVGLVFQFA
ncbi:ATP-binding cassette domain-containing protein, partial [Enterococcus faecalis]|nr:ATP-binding cassette domain-containing protein [Enterococcus faecalis]